MNDMILSSPELKAGRATDIGAFGAARARSGGHAIQIQVAAAASSGVCSIGPTFARLPRECRPNPIENAGILPRQTSADIAKGCGLCAAGNVGGFLFPMVSAIDYARDRARENFGLTPRHQPGSDSRRKGSELLHAHSIGETHGKISAVDHAQK